MRNRAWLMCAVAAFVGGCVTTETKTVSAAPPPVASAAKVAPVAGTQLDQANIEKVRHGDSLKAYPVNRYVDPNNPNVMHEGHVIYRREQPAGWNLNPNAPTVVPLGPVLAVADGARQPHPLPAELEQKMAEQNQLMASLIDLDPCGLNILAHLRATIPTVTSVLMDQQTLLAHKDSVISAKPSPRTIPMEHLRGGEIAAAMVLGDAQEGIEQERLLFGECLAAVERELKRNDLL